MGEDGDQRLVRREPARLLQRSTPVDLLEDVDGGERGALPFARLFTGVPGARVGRTEKGGRGLAEVELEGQPERRDRLSARRVEGDDVVAPDGVAAAAQPVRERRLAGAREAASWT